MTTRKKNPENILNFGNTQNSFQLHTANKTVNKTVTYGLNLKLKATRRLPLLVLCITRSLESIIYFWSVQ